MRLRPFILDCDFNEIENWISNDRAHAMWCANLIKYPIEKENFDHVMLEAAARYGDSPYVATTNDGKVVVCKEKVKLKMKNFENFSYYSQPIYRHTK